MIKKIVSEYDQEIPQSLTADKPETSRGRVTQQSRGTRKTNKGKQSALCSPKVFFFKFWWSILFLRAGSFELYW